MEEINILNLYGGLGGNRKLWVNCKVTMVEKDPKIASAYKAMFPDDEIIIGDAMQFLLDNYKMFDFIWASPPCQENSKMMKATKHDLSKYPDLSLYQMVIFLDNFFKGKYVIENVDPYYTPLIPPTKKIGRHLFWANFPIGSFEIPNIKNFINKSTSAGAKELKKWLGLDYEGNIYYKGNHCPAQVLRNCVHPETGKYILDCALGVIRKQNERQIDLFETL